MHTQLPGLSKHAGCAERLGPATDLLQTAQHSSWSDTSASLHAGSTTYTESPARNGSPSTSQLLSSFGGMPRRRFLPDTATSGRAADGAALPAHRHAQSQLLRQGSMSAGNLRRLASNCPAAEQPRRRAAHTLHARLCHQRTCRRRGRLACAWSCLVHGLEEARCDVRFSLCASVGRPPKACQEQAGACQRNATAAAARAAHAERTAGC